MKTRITILLICSLCLVSCEKYDWIGLIKGQSPAVNDRFGKYMEYGSSHTIPDINASSDEYSFAVIADIHACEDMTSLNYFVSDCRNRPELEHFALCLGDMSYGKGHFGEIAGALSPISKDDWKFFVTTGNHDLYFGEWETFAQYWPSSSYSFRVKTPSAGTDLFISFDTAEGTTGTRQRAWLEEILSKASSGNYRHICMFTHTNFFAKDRSQGTSGNLTIEECADLMNLFSKYGVDYVLCGHDHYYKSATFRSVEYYTLNAFSATADSHSYYFFSLGNSLTFKENRIQ